jgi:predicted nuclease of predicted toxin-antitoxin system
MNILADENFPRPLVEITRNQGHDVVWVRVESPGLADEALIQRAEAEGRVILTLDRGFWQAALQRAEPLKRSGIVLFRAFPSIPANLESLLDSILNADHPWTGYAGMVTASESTRVRIR